MQLHQHKDAADDLWLRLQYFVVNLGYFARTCRHTWRVASNAAGRFRRTTTRAFHYSWLPRHAHCFGHRLDRSGKSNRACCEADSERQTGFSFSNHVAAVVARGGRRYLLHLGAPTSREKETVSSPACGVGTNLDVSEMRNNVGVTLVFRVRCPTIRWTRAAGACFAS